MNIRAIVVTAALACSVVGCNSYRIVQTTHFVDDDGAIVRVDYGRAEKDHVNTYVSPMNHKEMEFRSNLVVEVRMPDGEAFTAWRCMNFAGNGTMYKTDDGEWYFLASGFTCKIAQQDADNENLHHEVYRGVLCKTPVKIPEKDTRWRKLKTQEKKYFAQ